MAEGQMKSSTYEDIDACPARITAEETAREEADAVQMAGIVNLINEGAKNVLNISTAQTQTTNGVTFTVNSDFSITCSGKATATAFFSMAVSFPAGAYYFSGMPESGGSGSYRLELRTGSASGSVFQTNESTTPTAFTRDNPWTGYFNIRVANGYEFTEAKTVKPMISERWKYSFTDKFVPYRPSLNDLWEMIQGGTRSLQRSASQNDEPAGIVEPPEETR